MRHIQSNKEYGNGVSYFTFYVLSDIHFGGLIDEKQLDADLKEIEKDRNGIVILGGDIIDAIAIRDKRFDPTTIADWVSLRDVIGSQIEYASDKLAPIKDKILFSLPGNHEDKAGYLWERNVYGDLCKSLGQTEVGARTTFSVTFRQSSKTNEKGGTRTLYGVAHHGITANKNEVTTTAEPYKMINDWPNARIAIAAHSHVSGIELIGKSFISTRGISMKEGVVVRGGTYLLPFIDGVTTYVEKRNIRPASTGLVRFYYKPKSDKISTDFKKIS